MVYYLLDYLLVGTWNKYFKKINKKVRSNKHATKYNTSNEIISKKQKKKLVKNQPPIFKGKK